MFCRYLRDVLCLRRRRVLGLRGKICIDDGRQDAMLVLSVSQRLANSNYVVSFVKDFFGIVFAMLGVCACGSCGSERQCADESTEFFGNLLGDLVHGRGETLPWSCDENPNQLHLGSRQSAYWLYHQALNR